MSQHNNTPRRTQLTRRGQCTQLVSSYVTDSCMTGRTSEFSNCLIEWRTLAAFTETMAKERVTRGMLSATRVFQENKSTRELVVTQHTGLLCYLMVRHRNMSQYHVFFDRLKRNTCLSLASSDGTFCVCSVSQVAGHKHSGWAGIDESRVVRARTFQRLVAKGHVSKQVAISQNVVMYQALNQVIWFVPVFLI